MSLVQIFAAMEDFTEEVNSEIATPTPTDGDFAETNAGVDFPQESGAIDNDVTMFADAAQGLEDIISLIEDAPGEDDAPLDNFAQKAANVALESNELVAQTGNPLAKTGDQGHTKKSAIDTLKGFAAKVWELLRKFGKKIVDWIRGTWAKYTDRLVKNVNAAKKLQAEAPDVVSRDGATITDAGLLAKIATHKGAEVGDVLLAVSEYADEQGAKSSIELTKQARASIDMIASGRVNSDVEMDKLLDVLGKAAGSYKQKATPEQSRMVKAAAGTETYLQSDAFFGGYRAWMTIPEDVEALEHWNHGISKVDDVKPATSIPAPNGEEIKAIAEYIIDMSKLIAIYKANINSLDELNKELDKAAAKSKDVAEGQEAALKKMQAVVPRIIKGPQVTAYAYATAASTIALQYCEAGIAAHRAPADKEKAAA
jgi:hypothetical protein